MRALTGIKPTAAPHLGNYFGSIEPALRLSQQHEAFYFIADYHALTTLHDAAKVRQYTREVAATWLALGLDVERASLFRQSDVPEVTELTWFLSCVTGIGLLERAHAYKAARDKGEEVNAGTFNYPTLMASDILVYDSNLVPVGKDQKQHIEMAQDMAQSFNARFGPTLVIPEAHVVDAVATIPGIDGRKMSKSYDNHLPVFATAKERRKRVMSIVTDSKGLDDPKDPDTCNVFALYKLFATPEQQASLAARYRAGGLGYGHAKQELFELIEVRFGPARETYEALLQDEDRMEAILRRGAYRARAEARATLARCRAAVGLRARPVGDSDAKE